MPMRREPCVVAIHQPELLPWLGFFDKLRQCDVFVLLDHVPFTKHYVQNRNRIRTCTPRGWSWLTVPVLTKGRFGQPLCEVQLSQAIDWRRKHLAALELNYHRAQAFDQYWPFLSHHYQASWDRLVDLSVPLIHWMAERFGFSRTVVRSSELAVEGTRSHLLLSICRTLGATEYLSGISGRDYLETELFERAGIAVRFQEFHHPVYRQCYEPFIPALSGLDLLLNHGEACHDMLAGTATPRLSQLFT